MVSRKLISCFFLLATSLAFQVGCTDRKLEIDLTMGTASLAQTDPTLIDALGAYVFVAFFNGVEGEDNSCPALLARPISGLGGPGLVSAQVVDAINEGDSSRDHVFGQLKLPGPHSFLVLGSPLRHVIGQNYTGNFPARPENLQDTLTAATGNIIAAGCLHQTLSYEEKVDLDVVLFPVGLK